ncbi:MAG: hypothetical protein AABX47_10495 [Nanoarchaeota archaeon]
MGTIKVEVPDEIETRFRKSAMARFGYAKGALSNAASEAFGEWTREQESQKTLGDSENPVDAMRGLLKHVKKSSVELQHEAANYRYEKYERNRRKRVP